MMQNKFDAWSHADAENLWASLTAELFDQLADAYIRLPERCDHLVEQRFGTEQ